MHVKPADGVRLRDPVKGDFVPETGREVPRTDYWLRRLRDGDAVEVKTGAKAPKKEG